MNVFNKCSSDRTITLCKSTLILVKNEINIFSRMCKRKL